MKVKEGQAVWVKDPAIAKDNLYNIGHGANRTELRLRPTALVLITHLTCC